MNYLNIGTALFGENGAFRTILGELFNGMGTIAEFFTTNDLGQIILVVALIGVIWAFVSALLSKFH